MGFSCLVSFLVYFVFPTPLVGRQPFKLLLLSSRKGGNLYRRYRGISKMEDNHLSNQPPENQVGDLLESCKVDNPSNYSGSIVYVCLYFSIP